MGLSSDHRTEQTSTRRYRAGPETPVSLAAPAFSVIETPTAAPTIGDILAAVPSRPDGQNCLHLPAACADAGTLGPFWVAAASCAGLSPFLDASTGQDGYSFSLTDDGMSVVVMAAASGLVPGKAIGTNVAARLFCSSLARRCSRASADHPAETIRRTLVDVNERLRRLGEVLGFEAMGEDDLSGLAFCWIPGNYRQRPALAGRMGGCAVFTMEDGVYRPILPRHADLVEVQPVDLARERMVVLVTEAVVGDVCGSPGVRAWLAERWAAPCGPFHMVDSLRYRRRGSHGPRAALVVWLRPEDPR